MALRLVGAGVGRTGTHSLKLAIERLTGAPCYHMSELIGNREAVPVWHAAIDGTMPDWDQFLAGYQATVDWPACAVWRELAHAYPDAPVLLSTRSSTEAWYGSMEHTIMQAVSQPTTDADHARHRKLTMAMLRQFCPDWPDPAAVRAAYERHNETVRSVVAPGRLVEWQPGDGWEPLCRALAMPVPDEPFPHVNTASQFRESMELDDATEPPEAT